MRRRVLWWIGPTLSIALIVESFTPQSGSCSDGPVGGTSTCATSHGPGGLLLLGMVGAVLCSTALWRSYRVRRQAREP